MDGIETKTSELFKRTELQFINFSIDGIDIEQEWKQLKTYEKNRYLPEKYILNENACICFWRDNTKTVSVRYKQDEFDKSIGFLMCCYQHYNLNLSRNKRRKLLSWIKQDNIKEYLMDMFINKNEMTVKEADVYLNNLKVDKKQNKQTVAKKGKHMKEENNG